MQEKLDEILEELEYLRERVAEIGDPYNEFVTIGDGGAVVSFVQEALEFADLDDIQEYTDENIIILHTNCFRTAALVRSCRALRHSCHQMSKEHLTPEFLLSTISGANQGDYFLVKSNIFSFSMEFEKIVADAISEGKVFFIICTNDLESIPESVRSKMRVVR